MTSQPAIALLSNGSYGVMITSACAGYSTWRELDVTRWREDATRDCWGQFCYVRDLSDDTCGRLAASPCRRPPMSLTSSFTPTEPSFVDGMATSRPAVPFVSCRMRMLRYAR